VRINKNGGYEPRFRFLYLKRRSSFRGRGRGGILSMPSVPVQNYHLILILSLLCNSNHVCVGLPTTVVLNTCLVI